MFCPLCQSEYREGFTQCSDCHIDLVAAFKDAQSSSMRLWKGDRQKLLDSILSALDAQDIPFHWKEEVNTTPSAKWLFSWTAIRSEIMYEVWVLRSDREKARAAIASLTN